MQYIKLFLYYKTSNIKILGELIMYYNRILRSWLIDKLNYFLIRWLIGHLIESSLKKYLSEYTAMK